MHECTYIHMYTVQSIQQHVILLCVFHMCTQCSTCGYTERAAVSHVKWQRVPHPCQILSCMSMRGMCM